MEKTFLGTSAKQLSIKEIPDLDIQLKLQTIADVKTEDDFQNIVNREIWVWCYQTGYQFSGLE